MMLFRRSSAVFVMLLFVGAVFSSAVAASGDKPSAQCLDSSKPYLKAKASFDKKASRYWALIKKKKARRRLKKRQGKEIVLADYVLKHPPVYKGPKKPSCLIKSRPKTKRKSTIGRVPDYLKAAKSIYKYTPRKVSEKEFKLAYAKAALQVGLTAEQVIGVYALETGGLGPYNRQSGIFNVTQNCKPRKPKGRPASTALGYAQLLSANTAAVLNENSEKIAKSLEFKAVLSQGARKKELLEKAALVRKMAKDVRIGIKKYKRRNNWREYVAFGKTKRGQAIHTLNLDIDIGPKLQVKKLKKIVTVAKRKGYESISSNQLELMNLVGYGRGLEMMGSVAKKAPTSNFFSRGGYYRNPVAKNITAEGLLNKLGKIIAVKRKKCGSVEFANAFKQVGKN